MKSLQADDFARDMENKLFYFGNFSSWEEAEHEGRNWGNLYQDESIFEQVKNAIEKIRAGVGVYEQDGIVFDRLLVNYELISVLLYVYAKRKALRVVDFGGSLGSTYFRYRKLFEELNVRWMIVEQAHFVEYGKQNISEVEFYTDIDECDGDIDVVLFSSVLSYLEKPYSILEKVLERKVPYIVIDEQAFSKSGIHEIRLQNVPPSIYKAVYPVHLFAREDFIKFFEESGYKCWEWDYKFGNIPVRENGVLCDTVEKGFLFSLDETGE